MRAPAMAMAAAVGALCAAGAAGCKRTLHWKIVEDQVQLTLGKDAKIDRVVCDEGGVTKGTHFPCTVTFADGGSAVVHIELTDDAGNARMTDGWVSAAKAASLIRDGLRKNNVEAQVECGTGLLMTGHHTCTASNADGSIHMDFELTENGDAKWHPL